jgi:hypothetical protein
MCWHHGQANDFILQHAGFGPAFFGFEDMSRDSREYD